MFPAERAFRLIQVPSVAVFLDAREMEFVTAFGDELRFPDKEGVQADAADVLFGIGFHS